MIGSDENELYARREPQGQQMAQAYASPMERDPMAQPFGYGQGLDPSYLMKRGQTKMPPIDRSNEQTPEFKAWQASQDKLKGTQMTPGDLLQYVRPGF